MSDGCDAHRAAQFVHQVGELRSELRSHGDEVQLARGRFLLGRFGEQILDETVLALLHEQEQRSVQRIVVFLDELRLGMRR